MRRLFAFLLLCSLAGIGFGIGCSSDPDTPLGTSFLDDSLIQSEPGEVKHDTITIDAGDTSFVTNAFLSKPPAMQIGRDSTIESAMVIRFDFSAPGGDTLLTVDRAELGLRIINVGDVSIITAEFYETLQPVDEADTLASLSLASSPIPDSSLVNTDRILQSSTTYTLPPALVQAWIRGDSVHNGIAIVLKDTAAVSDKIYGTRENSNEDLRPFLRVFFVGGDQSGFKVKADGSVMKELSQTTDLRLSDGVTRRVYLPADLAAFDEKTLLHDAKLVLHVVPNSSTTGDELVLVYAPTSSSVGSSGILSGDALSPIILPGTAKTIEFSIRKLVERFIADSATNHGFVVRYQGEGISARRVDFYGSSAPDSLRPRMRFTFSEPPAFPKR